ncbi:dermonecrotic toxin domain-containing protein [Pseudomonas sp. R5(2019)]|uniref:dermonecrotic toxin domain-containing protein n=1 Tax=Pseudomonas sp. R5(2019) TaxID=2697566 RepID=UPI001412D3FC|nr:DUF6543 domain-containing protein [Pseudomonas sp. R5(2019)]NBA95446.1 hypothetical protein [Pseudomonas sp. R5(2019)]
MTSSFSPFGLIAASATMANSLSKHFASRPSLRSVASALLREQWAQPLALTPQDPAKIFIVTPVYSSDGEREAADGYHCLALPDALILRLCTGATLNLIEGVQFLTTEAGAEFPQALEADLHALELMLNELGADLLDHYKSRLVDYWNLAQGQSVSPWQWLSGHLFEQFKMAVAARTADQTIDQLEAATALALADYPEARSRARVTGATQTQAYLLSLDPTGALGMHPQLASAIVIERKIEAPAREIVLLFTLTGELRRYSSRQALAQALAREMGTGTSPGAHELNLHTPAGNIFQAQARTLLEQQLLCIDVIASSWQGQSPDFLQPALEQATSLLQTSGLEEKNRLEQLWKALPDWLADADAEEKVRYRDGLLALAQSQGQGKGEWVLEGVETIDEYATRLLSEQIARDGIDLQGLALADIEIVNQQVTAVPVGGPGNPSAAGAVETVTLSLVRFALENLGALHPGRVQVRAQGGHSLPDRLTVEYLKRLVQQVDVGGNYPGYLRSLLLDDPEQARHREALLKQQLEVQVPLLALQYSIQGHNGLDERGWRCVNAAFQSAGLRRAGGQPITLARLGFVSRPGAEPDVALGAYVIGPAETAYGPVILYRPLHLEPLVQFNSRQAVLETIKTDTALEADILRRLPEKRRPIYALGGFESPHIVRFGSGSDFAPIDTPAPATLSEAVLGDDLITPLYHDIVGEMIEVAHQQSLSTAQSRWASFWELGWLMFNTLLPMVSGPVATAGWLLQAMASVQGALAAQANADKATQAERLVDLLFNIVLVLSLRRYEVEPGTPQRPAEPVALTPRITPQALTSPSSQTLQRLDFSWSAIAMLNERQRVELASFKIAAPAGALAPVPHGQFKGLYEHQGAWLARVDRDYYRVALGTDEVRIIDAADDAHLGPWLRADAEGEWGPDLRLRLRGGADRPESADVERRIGMLEKLWTGFNAQKEALHDALAAQFKVLDSMPESSLASDPLREAYVEDLDKYLARLSLADDALKKQNDLRAVARFSEKHADYIYELALRSQEQAMHVHWLFVDKDSSFHTYVDSFAHGLSTIFEEGTAQDRAQFYRHYTDSLQLIDRAILLQDRDEQLKTELFSVPPFGRKYAANLERAGRQVKSVLAWRAQRLGFLCVLAIRDLTQTPGVNELLKNAGSRARVAGQTLLALEKGYDPEQMIEPLQSVVEQFSRAEDNAENFRLNLDVGQRTPELDRLITCIAELRELARARLDRARDMLDEYLPVATRPGKAAGTLIRTRHRGIVVGRLRPAAGADEQALVELVEPVRNEVLATFRQHNSDQVWDEVATRKPGNADKGRPLDAIVGEARKWLNGTERVIENARLQSKTAKIPVEIEEILQHRATRLQGLADDIETALTRSNVTDRPTLEHGSSVVLDHALTTAAQRCMKEGRLLRIAMTKARAPTDTGVDYLVQQKQVVISPVGGRVPTADKKGSDFLQEYVIKDLEGHALWYAHFHYPSRSTVAGGFKVAHLKTAAQRHLGFKKQLKDGLPVVPVYRYPISPALAQALFLHSEARA